MINSTTGEYNSVGCNFGTIILQDFIHRLNSENPLVQLNPLSPNSDQDQFPANNIHTL